MGFVLGVDGPPITFGTTMGGRDFKSLVAGVGALVDPKIDVVWVEANPKTLEESGDGFTNGLGVPEMDFDPKRLVTGGVPNVTGVMGAERKLDRLGEFSDPKEESTAGAWNFAEGLGGTEAERWNSNELGTPRALIC